MKAVQSILLTMLLYMSVFVLDATHNEPTPETFHFGPIPGEEANQDHGERDE